jgi:hypothetical protein
MFNIHDFWELSAYCLQMTVSPYTGTFYLLCASVKGTAVAQWLRFCATNRKVAGSIQDGVIGFFR